MTNPDSSNIAFGCCHCGCGGTTKIAPYTSSVHRWTRGQPLRYINGHNRLKYGSYKPWFKRFTVEDRGFTTPCHIWQGYRNRAGYGVLQIEGKGVSAHRVFYEAAFGTIPFDVELDHLCRIRICVNPAHLEPVTHAENVQRGNNAKLTPRQVREIRRLYKETPLTQEAIAVLFKLRRSQIGKIVRREQWRNI